MADDDFAGMYADRRGRPWVPPSVMVRALMCATHDRSSDRETARRTRVDLDWKATMGVEDEFAGSRRPRSRWCGPGWWLLMLGLTWRRR